MSILIFCIGLLAQACFSARILIQWFLSEKKHEVISPTLFWVFSLIGSYLMFYYGWLRNDFSIIVGQFISFYIYIGNLRLGRVAAYSRPAQDTVGSHSFIGSYRYIAGQQPFC